MEKPEPVGSYTLADLQAFFLKNNEKPFRAAQIFEWIYQKNALSYGQMTNLSKDLRSFLEVSCPFPVLKLKEVQASQDGETVKFLFELADGLLVESVFIRSFERRTLCVSSQVGCRSACSFCASGRRGFFRSLKTAEIVEQLLLVQSHLKVKVSHVVFMGMGEPLDNLENVFQAIRVIHEPRGLNLSSRRISVSTVGLLEGIDRLLNFELKVNLVLSLHAASQKLREKLIPSAKANPLEALLEKMALYAEKTSRDITFEYILIDGCNSSEQAALELCFLLKPFKHFSVNLIPYNPVAGLELKRPAVREVEAFETILLQHHLPVTRRYTKGDDIGAACGQLALRKID
ncbi:MAG: 23S rRNA (adenine(2503)-C(2))-methyltransferase RlmN [Parachlamydiales bacterium]|jgi:23S rRNA (adenine2503-C2)-methyltransferase